MPASNKRVKILYSPVMVNFFICGFLTGKKSRQKTLASLSKECGTNMLILKSKSFCTYGAFRIYYRDH